MPSPIMIGPVTVTSHHYIPFNLRWLSSSLWFPLAHLSQRSNEHAACTDPLDLLIIIIFSFSSFGPLVDLSIGVPSSLVLSFPF